MTRYHLTLKSENRKTGPIPVSTTSADTCPTTCGQFDTCYAKSGPSGIHFRKVAAGTRGTDLKGFTAAIAALPSGTLWRHNQAGDLPGEDAAIDVLALRAIVRANRGKRGFTYTHKPLSQHNVRAIRACTVGGFTVNISADTIAAADAAKSLAIAPVVVVLPATVRENFTTPGGNKVVICPAVTHDGVSCATCKLCAWATRDAIIGFPAHGAKARQVRSDYVQIGGVA